MNNPSDVAQSGWRTTAFQALREPNAPRVLSFSELLEFVRRVRPTVTPNTLARFVPEAVALGVLFPAARGVYVNQACTPRGTLEDAASHIRSGAVVSLRRVLGEVGTINNPSAVVTAVIPLDAGERTARSAEVDTSTGQTFRFHALSPRFFPPRLGTREELYLASRSYDCFKPEPALLQWLHLANNARSSVPEPPIDIDVDTLDLDFLRELADRLKMRPILDAYLAKCEALHYGEERSTPEPATPPPAPRKPPRP